LFCLTLFNYHTAASNHANSLLFPNTVLYSAFLTQEKFISLYSVNQLFSEKFAKIFCLSIPLNLSFTIFISLKLHSFFLSSFKTFGLSRTEVLHYEFIGRLVSAVLVWGIVSILKESDISKVK
jgi:hypothetical protein